MKSMHGTNSTAHHLLHLCRLCFRCCPHSDQSLMASATAAATRVVKRSANLTTINTVGLSYYKSSPLMLPDLLAAGAASGLATRLRKLTGIAVEAAYVPQQLQALRQCTSLTHLDIRGSGLWSYLGQSGQQAAEELTAALQGLPSLTRLHVVGYETYSDSCMTRLASALQPLTQLQHLHLAEHNTGVAALAALVPALSAMPALQTLVVSGNNPVVDETAGRAEALCALLSVAPRLTHLDVGSNTLHNEGAALLAPALRGMTCLQHLNLSYNKVGSRGLAALAPALAALPNLHTLDLSGCDLHGEFASLLQPLLAKAGSPLRKLALCKTIFGWDDAQALAAGLSTAPQLQELNVQGISFRVDQEKGWMALAPGLSSLGPSLQSLSLGVYNQRKSVAASTALAAALQPLTGLTRLEATSLFPSATVVAISPALMGMRRLQVLNLYGNNLSAEGTAAIAEVLPALSVSLTHLTLSHCNIDAEAAASALAPALAQAIGLVELHLRYNPFGPQGGQWLPPVLTALPHLRKVDLGSCGWMQAAAWPSHVPSRTGTACLCYWTGMASPMTAQQAKRCALCQAIMSLCSCDTVLVY